MTLNDLLIDKRIVQRNIEQGKLDTAQYQKMLDALPDLSDKVWRRNENPQPAGNLVKKPLLHSTSVQQPPAHLQASPAFDEAGAADELDSDEFDADDDLNGDDELADDELPEEEEAADPVDAALGQE